MAALKSRIEKLEAAILDHKFAAYDRVVPLLSDTKLEALAAMPDDDRPVDPEALAAMLKMWELFDAAERRLLFSEWKAAGVPVGVVENGSK